MWETAATRIVAMGGTGAHASTTSTAHRARSDGRVVAVRAKTPDGERRFEAEHFISTMPVRYLVRALDPPAPAPVARGGEGLSYRDFLWSR